MPVLTPSTPSAAPCPPPLIWVLLPAVAFAMLAGALFASERNTALFLAWNAAAQALPASLWAGITNFGATLGAFALIAPALLWRPRWVASALLAAPFAAVYAQGLKTLFAEPRPPAVLALDSFNVIGLPLHTDSFPSGHTVTAFVVAGVVTFCATTAQRRWLGAVALALAALVAFSRVAVGAHWPLDLFAGAAGGWLCAAVGCAWAARWRFWTHARGVRTMAVLLLLVCVALAIEDLGYPEGQWSQYLLAVWGALGTLLALRHADRGPEPA